MLMAASWNFSSSSSAAARVLLYRERTEAAIVIDCFDYTLRADCWRY